jgi:hypothetical protein
MAFERASRRAFLDFHVAADLNVPAEPLLENAVAERLHFGEVVK